MAKRLKVSILGGGSAYTPGLIEGFIRQKDEIALEELTLMDIDETKLNIVGTLVKSMLEQELPWCQLRFTTDKIEAIKNMDFIICQIRVGGLAARHIDESIPPRFGVIGQETTGPGGFSMAVRTIPVMCQIARDIEKYNPSAWLINYTNPTGLVAEAIRRTSSIRQISICDEPMVLQETLADFLRVPPEKLFFEYLGLNHLAWATRVLLDGKDVLPELHRQISTVSLEEIESLFSQEVMKDPKVKVEITNTLRLFQVYGILPSPYLQYYYFSDEILEQQLKSGKTRAQIVMELEKGLLDEYQEIAKKQKEFQVKRGGKWHADMMVGIIGAIASDSRQIFIVNVPNKGSIPDLPDDKIVEVPSIVDAGGAHPLTAGHIPTMVRGLIQAVAAYEELTVEAALTRSYQKSLIALAAHPLVMTLEKARGILDSYIREHENFPIQVK